MCIRDRSSSEVEGSDVALTRLIISKSAALDGVIGEGTDDDADVVVEVVVDAGALFDLDSLSTMVTRPLNPRYHGCLLYTSRCV